MPAKIAFCPNFFLKKISKITIINHNKQSNLHNYKIYNNTTKKRLKQPGKP